MVLFASKNKFIKMSEKPGEKALEAMKKMSNEVVAFKIPQLPKTKKNQMKILTEEKYIEVRLFQVIIIPISSLLVDFTLNCIFSIFRKLARSYKKISFQI